MTEPREPKEIAAEIHATVRVLNALYAEAATAGIHCDLTWEKPWQKVESDPTGPGLQLLVFKPVLRIDL